MKLTSTVEPATQSTLNPCCSLGQGQTFLAQNKLSTFEVRPSRMRPFSSTKNGRHLAWDLSRDNNLVFCQRGTLSPFLAALSGLRVSAQCQQALSHFRPWYSRCLGTLGVCISCLSSSGFEYNHSFILYGIPDSASK